MRLSLGAMLVGFLIGCGAGDGAPIIYDPQTSKRIEMWPDAHFTIADATTATQQRLHLVPGDNLTLDDWAMPFSSVFDDLSLLDGFGTTSALFIRASAAIDPASLPASGDGSGSAQASVFLVDLDKSPIEFLDFETALTAETDADPASTLVVSPMVPLQAKTRYGFAVTRRVHTTNGKSLVPTAAMSDKIGESRPLVDALIGAGAIGGEGDLAAASVFTTESTYDDSTTIAQAIRAETVPYHTVSPCVLDPGGTYRVCEGAADAFDYRDAQHHVDDAALVAHAPYTLPVTTYLPATDAGPYPTLIFGHGLGGDRHQAALLATFLAPQGIATVAIDAPLHGDHPDQPAAKDAIDTVIAFFGFSLTGTQLLDSRRFRDNFRCATYDKLQIVEMLRPGLDLDGDGMKDVGVDPLMYLGVSLGGIMSAELAALSPELRALVAIVPGSRIVEIVTESAMLAPVIVVAKGDGTDGDVARFLPLVQNAIDRADSGAYAIHVLRDRLAGYDSASPQFLMQMVIDDDTVPNPSNRFFARAMGAAQVGDELQHIGAPVKAAQPLPTSANYDAMHTAGIFEYDIDWKDGGPATQMATHSNIAPNPVAIEQTTHFLQTTLATGVGELIDPYRTLGIKP